MDGNLYDKTPSQTHQDATNKIEFCGNNNKEELGFKRNQNTSFPVEPTLIVSIYRMHRFLKLRDFSKRQT